MCEVSVFMLYDKLNLIKKNLRKTRLSRSIRDTTVVGRETSIYCMQSWQPSLVFQLIQFPLNIYAKIEKLIIFPLSLCVV